MTHQSIKSVRIIPTGRRANRFSEFVFHCCDDIARRVRAKSSFKGGFKHNYVRDVETGEVKVFGSNRFAILNDIKEHFGITDVKVRASFEYFRARG